jgi:hypothetical protein
MFNTWLKSEFDCLRINEFENSEEDIFVLDATEEEGKQFVLDVLNQNIEKRPDLVAKINGQYIIGEAKWIGQPGGNQEKQVKEVVAFCENQRGAVRSIGIVDGFPWAIYNDHGRIINSKEVVLIQESEHNIMSALLLQEYFSQF